MAQCLSGAGPCEKLCSYCIKYAEEKARDELNRRIRDAVWLLQDQGWKIVDENGNEVNR